MDDRLKYLQEQRADALRCIEMIDNGQKVTGRVVLQIYVRVAAQLAELIAHLRTHIANEPRRRQRRCGERRP